MLALPPLPHITSAPAGPLDGGVRDMDPTLLTAGDGTSSGVDDDATASGTAALLLRVRAAAAGADGPDASGAADDETTGTGDGADGAAGDRGSTSLNPAPGGGGRTGISFSDPAALVPPKTLL